MKPSLKTSLFFSAALLTIFSGSQAFALAKPGPTESTDAMPSVSTPYVETDEADYCENYCEEQHPNVYLECVANCRQFLTNIIKSEKNSKLRTIQNIKDS